jgi:endonuclease-3
MAKAKPKATVSEAASSKADVAKTGAKNVAPTMTALRKQAASIAAGLARTYPDAECALHHSNVFQLLVATILSAQCTDVRVNMVTPILFGRYPNPADLAAATQEDVEVIIHSLGFFRAKATNIRGMSQALVDHYGGEVPQDLEQLIELPGIGRKTANVVLGTSFGIASGVVVDTHVKRLTRLLGLTKANSPEQIERDLMPLLPSSEWVNFSHRLIHHGRLICIARRPQCEICPLLPDCNRTGLPPLK